MTPRHAGKQRCLLPGRTHLQLVAGAAQDPDVDLLVLIEKHHSMCCQTCSWHDSRGVLHHFDLTYQSEESEDTPAEHAVLHEPPGEHVVPDGTPAEHAVHDAAPAEHAVKGAASAEHAVHEAIPVGMAGAFHHEVSDAAGPAQVPGLVQQQALFYLIGDQAAAAGLLR